MNKSSLFRTAHKIARTLEGNYRACLAEGLRQAWAIQKGENMKKVEVKDREMIEQRIEIFSQPRGVARRKSEEYRNFVITEYKKVLSEGNETPWMQLMDEVEGKAKELFN